MPQAIPGISEDVPPQTGEHGSTNVIQVDAVPPYSIYIEDGLALRCGHLFRAHGIERAVLISNPVVGALHGGAVRAAIREDGVQVESLEVPDGEAYKTMRTVERLCEQLADLRADRATALVALGGGVVGDVVGFAAAIYLRGVPLVHFPTTILSMVDSSIGGKVGVDLPQGKNLVGAFYNPRVVVSDPSMLLSLPPRILAAGMAEVIKVACLASPDLFAFLEKREPPLGPQDMGQLMTTAIEIKVRVISEDPYERGVRATLNLGHTLGHALEAARGFHQILHGEAVAVGLVAAVRIARSMGILEEDYEARLIALLEKHHLPTRIGYAGWERVEAALGIDKKRMDARTRFVLPVRLGQVEIRADVPPQLVHEIYESLLETEEAAAAESEEEGVSLHPSREPSREPDRLDEEP